MTSLLTTAVDESCHNHLRGRRRSSVHPLSAVPRLFSSAQSGAHPNSTAADESAISDDIELAPRSGPLPGDDTKTLAHSTIPNISPLSHAHMSDYAPKMIIPRHQDSLGSTIEFSLPSSPTFVSSPQNLCPEVGPCTRKNSYDDLVSNLPILSRCSGQNAGDEKCKYERMKWRLAAGFFAYFLCGWGDGVTGTVLPLFMADFHISFATSSLLFAGTTCGFCIGTLLVERIMRGLGRTRVGQQHSAWYPYFPYFSWRKPSILGNIRDPIGRSAVQSRHLMLLLGSLLHALFFIIMGTRGGFPALFLAYIVSAFARAMLTASLNIYFATVMPPSISYGFGIWSMGGVASPLVCQAAVAAGVPWYQFYLVSLVFSAFNVGFLVLTFRPTPSEWSKERDEERIRMRRKRSTDSNESALSGSGGDGNQATQKAEEKNAVAPKSTLRLALSLGHQWAFLIFTLAYCGCETTTQGFMVSYLLGTRHANKNTVGYVTSGFWGGITIGRLTWGYVMPRLDFTQRKYLVHLCLTMGMIMELLIWVVNSNIGNAFSASVVGMVFGPVFPAALSLANALLPERVRMLSMALICSAASIGAAIFPFVTGVISASKGVHTLTYVTVPLSASLVLGWFLFPSRVPVVSK